MSRLFNRLPGHPRTPAGRERQILRMLPKALAIGTAMLALPSLAVRVAALLAWPAVMLEPAFGALLLVAGFVAHIWQDHRLAGRVVLPDWYLPLRRQLSIVACVCLALGTFAVSH